MAHSSAETYRHFDLIWCKVAWEVRTGYMRRVETGTFQLAAAKVKPPQIGLAKIAV